jgi:enoyl-CoA hydratase/carnithine racemase
MTDTAWSPLRDDVTKSCEGRVALDVEGRVAILTINRPDKLNAIDSSVLTGVRTALSGIEDSQSIGAVVLRGAGRAFSAGGDLEEVSALVRDKVRFSAFLDNWHESLLRLQNTPLPTVAAVHGFAFAGGFEVTQACDFVVMARHAVLGDQHANFGLFPAGGSTQRLPRMIAPRAAKWMLMSGEAIDSATALGLGLANRVVDDSDVFAEARRMALTLSSKSRSDNAAIKAAVHLGADRPLTEAIAAERHYALDQMASADAQTGFAAFRSRTEPVFNSTNSSS